jgi:hypothetical protein
MNLTTTKILKMSKLPKILGAKEKLKTQKNFGVVLAVAFVLALNYIPILAIPTSAYATVQQSAPAGEAKDSKHYEHQITKEIPLEGISNLQEFFPESVAIDDGRFCGTIDLRSEDAFKISNIYEIFSGQVDRSHVFSGLPDNDLSRIPLQMDFDVSSEESEGATRIKTLKLVDCVYKIQSADYLGRPSAYEACATYRGEEKWLELHHYLVTANYAGVIEAPAIESKSEEAPKPNRPNESLVFVEEPAQQQAQVQARENEATKSDEATITDGRLEAAAIPLVSGDLTHPIANKDDAQEAQFPWFPVVLAAASVSLLLLGLLALFLIRSANMRLVSFDGYDNPKTELRCRASLEDGIVRLRMPDSFAGFEFDLRYELLIKPSLASKQGVVELCWRNQVWMRRPLAPCIDVSLALREEMASATTAAVLCSPDLESDGFAVPGYMS